MSITTGAVSEYTPAAMGLTADLRARASAARRVVSIDIVRGVVMVLMAIDHVRVFSVSAGGLTPGIFFTRWITHFVAPRLFSSPGRAPTSMVNAWETGRSSRSSCSRAVCGSCCWS